ncbi:hypothetical protein C0992_008749, partial [Termitomyces sp. T32_za158]
TNAYGHPVPNPDYLMDIPQPQYPLCPSNPTRSPGTGAMSMLDRFMVPLSARDPRLTGTRVPPITPTTPKYSSGDSPKPHPKIDTPSLLLAPDLLPWEPTMPTPPQLPPPGTIHSNTRALWPLPWHAPHPHP